MGDGLKRAFAATKATRKTSVTAKCMGCGFKREIMAGAVAPGDHPMCEKCGMPMIAVSAQSKR